MHCNPTYANCDVPQDSESTEVFIIGNHLTGIRISNGPDSFNGITKRVSVRVKLTKTKPKETQ